MIVARMRNYSNTTFYTKPSAATLQCVLLQALVQAWAGDGALPMQELHSSHRVLGTPVVTEGTKSLNV